MSDMEEILALVAVMLVGVAIIWASIVDGRRARHQQFKDRSRSRRRTSLFFALLSVVLVLARLALGPGSVEWSFIGTIAFIAILRWFI